MIRPRFQRLRGFSDMLGLCLLLLVCARAQRQLEDPRDESLDVLTTPERGEACGYQSCMPIKPGWLNVHIVPHTHSELGHGYNFDQHFTGEEGPYPPNNINMKRILDAVITALYDDNRRKFTITDTAYLFHWWNKRHPDVHRMVYELVRQGRLTIAGGGLGISDEASTSYHAVIDHFTYSLRKLNSTFRACARPLVAWAADVFGHSREFTSLMALMGFDGLFINPISYDELAARMGRKSLEFLWRGNDDLGSSTDMFTHTLFDGYWAPPGFCFSKLCSDPLLITNNLFSNIEERINKFIESILYRQAPNYNTRNIMVVMGHRKAYFDAEIWFQNIEKLISYTNYEANRRGANITVFYSNPSCYLLAVHDENPELETKQDDFFPYVHDKDSYTVGMYSSRPTLKYLIREAHVYLQIAKQLQLTANLGPFTELFNNFSWVMGVVQDHSIATGVLRESVKQYYVEKIDNAITSSTDMISQAITKLRESPNHIPYHRCQFNISSCAESRYMKYTVQVYNPLGWPVTVPVRLPVYQLNSKHRVYDSQGHEVKSVSIKLPDSILNIKGRVAKAEHELIFIATGIPPVGFRSYYIETTFYIKKKPINKKVKTGDINKYLRYVPADNDKQYSNIDKINRKPTYDDTIRKFSDNIKFNMRTLGVEANENKISAASKRFVVYAQNDTEKTASSARRSLHTIGLDRDGRYTTENNNLENIVEIEEDEDDNEQSTTEAELNMLPMLRDYLHKKNILRKLEFSDTENELIYPNEFNKSDTSTSEFDAQNASPADIEINIRMPDRKVPINDILDKTLSTKVPFTANAINMKIPVRTTTLRSTNSNVKALFNVENKSLEEDSDTNVPIISRRGTLKSVGINLNDPAKSAIVPDETTTTESSNLMRRTQSVLVIPVKGTTGNHSQNTSIQPLLISAKDTPLNTIDKKESIEDTSSTEDIVTETTPDHSLESLSTPPNVYQINEDVNSRHSYKPHGIGSNVIRKFNVENIESQNSMEVNGRKITTDTEHEVTSGDIETTTGSTTYMSSSTDYIVVEPKTNEPDIAVVPVQFVHSTSTERYFKVEGGSKLFIGNKYVRINLDEKQRPASINLRNGVKINLSILMFYYVSDTNTEVPEANKPPGAYIFRPANVRIVNIGDYKARVVKTSIVEELHVELSSWASFSLRIYVDSPVIEVHWLVGPIPTTDGIGKDVFIRYKTDLQNGGAFYTDSSGRQTIKRIRGTRATYQPVDLDPITGNLYPVTSKVYIEDTERNLRFAVFNDRCQGAGSLRDGSVDLMLHRRILTDDIGFGAFLNETEGEEGIRAAGTHYLYLTKSDKNRIFEKKFAKEIAMAPRVLVSDSLSYTDEMRQEFNELKNEFSALTDKLPIGIHLLSFERLTNNELLVRLENYLEKSDTVKGVRYVALRRLFTDIKVVWLKETMLAANIFKDQWAPPIWKKKNLFFRSFNEYYGGGNGTEEVEGGVLLDDLGGRGLRLAPQQIRTFIVKYEYVKV